MGLASRVNADNRGAAMLPALALISALKMI
jgi:hypothetical protein